jgi:DNA polymerase bacteriophage-type
MRRLWVDTETRSTVPIRQGNVKYATAVEIIMLQWAVDDGPIHIVDMTALCDDAFSRHDYFQFQLEARSANEIWAHQAEFDRTMLETTSWWQALRINPKAWRCTAALARMHGMPGALDKLCSIFKLPAHQSKFKGKDIGELFWKPNAKGVYNTRWSHPEAWQQFLAYGGQDVVAMRHVWRKTPKWNATPRMWRVWDLDFRMNHRGVGMDLRLATNAVAATTEAKKILAARAKKLSRINTQGLEETDSALEATTQRNRLLAYMADFGVTLPDLTADTVERRLEDESLPVHIKELLRIRQKASKASTAKYQRVLNQHVGGRLFNLLVFCGAMRTGRWAGRTLQPQNLPRPKHTPEEIALAIAMFHRNAIDLHDPDDVMGLASSCLRGLIVPGAGRKLVTSDLANVEGRFMAWIAGEEWKLEAFAAYDRKEGPDLYKVSYARPFNIDPNDIADEGDQRRQIGKVMELALQYYGGVGAFCSMAETYGLRLDELAVSAWPTLPDDVKREAQRLWPGAIKRRRTYGLNERVWVVCQALVLLWRQAHPMIVAFWEALDNAVKDAIRSPGKRFKAGERITVDRIGNWLRIQLPSGRYLSYPAPRIKVDGRLSRRSFVGVDPYTRQWGRIFTYSGKDTENVVQGGCADLLIDGLLAADDAGYDPVLSVHDEIIADPLDTDEYDDVGLSKLLVESSWWATELPLAAKGKTSYRYSK